MSSYKLIPQSNTVQAESDRTFRGGVPNMPKHLQLPICTLCGAEMTFYFQIAFPDRHVWNGWIMCVFHCTSCYDVENFWPKAAYGGMIHIPDDYVDKYQTNFRVLVYEISETSLMRTEARRVLKFERIVLEKLNPNNRYYGTTKVGGKPAWSYENEPDLYKRMTYMGGGFVFLMQIAADWKFTPLEEAPPQPWFQPPETYKESPYYYLFNGPPIYFLGTTSLNLDPPRVYVIAQRA